MKNHFVKVVLDRLLVADVLKLNGDIVDVAFDTESDGIEFTFQTEAPNIFEKDVDDSICNRPMFSDLGAELDNTAADQLSLVAGGIEKLRLTEKRR